jgi:predicted glycosyl hydrolase (DUF1957 family)
MKPGLDIDGLIPKFEVLYEKYDIDLIGYWSVDGDETETYMLYRYESEEDMMAKADLLMKENDYLEMREEISSYRVSMAQTTLLATNVPG